MWFMHSFVLDLALLEKARSVCFQSSSSTVSALSTWAPATMSSSIMPPRSNSRGPASQRATRPTPSSATRLLRRTPRAQKTASCFSRTGSSVWLITKPLPLPSSSPTVPRFFLSCQRSLSSSLLSQKRFTANTPVRVERWVWFLCFWAAFAPAVSLCGPLIVESQRCKSEGIRICPILSAYRCLSCSGTKENPKKVAPWQFVSSFSYLVFPARGVRQHERTRTEDLS